MPWAGGMQSNPNWPLIAFFACLGVLAASLAALGWRHDSRGWRLFTCLFSASMLAQAAYEFSFAYQPVREWIRVDLLLALPIAATGITILLGRGLWLLVRWRLSQSR